MVSIEHQEEQVGVNINSLSQSISPELRAIQDSTLNATFDTLLVKIKDFYEIRKHLYRKEQREAFESFILGVQEGKKEWLIKLPWWAWKTFLFCEIAKALGLPTIILVSRIGLVYNTREELIWSNAKIGSGFLENDVHTISSEEWESSWELLESIIKFNGGKFRWVLVIPYASLNYIRKNHSYWFEFLVSSCWFIVSDEAHRSLWDVTSATEELLVSPDIQDKVEVEHSIEEFFEWKLHLYTTATPKLIHKDLRDKADIFYSATMQQVELSWDLIIPQKRSVWPWFLDVTDKNTSELTGSEVEEYPLDKYTDQYGNLLYETLVDEYLEEKSQNQWYLPWISHCTTIEQADFITDYFNTRWVRAVKCTSDKVWAEESVSDSRAKEMLEKDMIDMVVTCAKVWEWWDVPLLRASIRFTPTKSPVRSIQWNARITRIVSQRQEEIYLKGIWERYRTKTPTNTCIIEPEYWVAQWSDHCNSQTNTLITEWEVLKRRTLSGQTIPGSFELMYELWEIDETYLQNNNITLLEEIIKVETLEQHQSELEEMSIKNIRTLLGLWSLRYQKLFGLKPISRILSEQITQVWHTHLHLLAEKLDFEHIESFHRKELESQSIDTTEKLVKLGMKRYRELFGSVIMRDILWELGQYSFDYRLSILWEKLGLWKHEVSEIYIKEIIKQEITQEQIEEYFFNWIEWDKEASYNVLLWLTAEQISKINIKWHKIQSILGVWWYNTRSRIHNPSWFQEFIAELFDQELELLTKEGVEDRFFNWIEWDKEASYNELMKFDQKEILWLQIKGKKIMGIVTESGWEVSEKWKNQSVVWFQEFISWLFDKELELLTKEGVEDYFFNWIEWDKGASYNELMKLSKGEIHSISIWTHKITSIATIYEFTKSSRVAGWGKVFREFISLLFGKELNSQEKIKKDIEKYFFNWVKWDQEASYFELIWLSQRKIQNISYQSKKIGTLALDSGYNEGNVRDPYWFRSFVSWLFWKQYKESVKNYFSKIVDWANETETYNQLLAFGIKEVKELDIWWKKITFIYQTCWWNNPNNLGVTVELFREFVNWLYQGGKN